MHVTNREPCTLIIGETQIPFGETRAVEPEWEPRCEQLATKGALFVHHGKPDDRPARGMTPAELFAAMSPAEQRAAIAQVRAAEMPSAANKPSPELVRELVEFGETFDPPGGRANEDTVPDGKVPAGAPADFATCHVNKALAFVRKCEDVGLLTALGNSEERTSVLEAIIARCEALKPKAN